MFYVVVLIIICPHKNIRSVETGTWVSCVPRCMPKPRTVLDIGGAQEMFVGEKEEGQRKDRGKEGEREERGEEVFFTWAVIVFLLIILKSVSCV